MKRLTYMTLVCALLLSSGCAVFNRENTPALNFVEKNLIPKENPGKALSYPLVIPLGAVAATMDMFIFHPLYVVSDSWDDTTDLLWKKLDWQTHYATSAASLVPRAALSPIIFTGDFLFRCSFDVNKHRSSGRQSSGNDDYARKQEEKKKTEALLSRQAAEALSKGSYDEAVILSDKALASNSYLYDVAAIKATALLEAGKTEQISSIPGYLKIFTNDTFILRFSEHLLKSSPVDAMRLLSVMDKHSFFPSVRQNKNQELTPAQKRLFDTIVTTLKHEDRAVRLKAIQVIGKRVSEYKGLRVLLEETAKGSDPVMSFAAKEVLR